MDPAMAFVCPVVMRQAYSLHHSTVAFITLQHTSPVEPGAVQNQYVVDVKGRKLRGSLASPGRGRGTSCFLVHPPPSVTFCECVIDSLERHLMVTGLRAGELALSGRSCWGEA